MKNIHILPTDKRSFIYKDIKGNFGFSKDWIEIPTGRTNQNIYITSNEEVKDCWVLNTHSNQVYFLTGYFGIQPLAKKIILTTDFTLSPDVHKIPDEFIEWFVDNPSCEEVEIERGYRGYNLVNYKIIIPKEEPKQERMYSEEEVRLMLSESFKASQEGYNITSNEIIEQFKKK